jgi:hypothetical protein
METLSDPHDEPPPPHPLQFSLRGLMGVVTAVCILFSTLRWLGVSTVASLAVLVILVVSTLAAVGLMIAIAGEKDEG